MTVEDLQELAEHEQQRQAQIAAFNAEDPSGNLAALNQQLWDLQDAAAAAATATQAAADAAKLLNDSLSLQAQHWTEAGRIVEAIERVQIG